MAVDPNEVPPTPVPVPTPAPTPVAVDPISSVLDTRKLTIRELIMGLSGFLGLALIGYDAVDIINTSATTLNSTALILPLMLLVISGCLSWQDVAKYVK